MTHPDWEFYNDRLHYEAETGRLIWKIRPKSTMRVGDEAGTVTNCGYRRIYIKGKGHLAHRIVWLLAHREWPTRGLDHIDRNPLNNRIENLRLCNQVQNMQNLSLVGNGASKHRGVWWSKNSSRWVAEIRVYGAKKCLGYFRNEEDAAAAYLEAKRLMHSFYVEQAA